MAVSYSSLPQPPSGMSGDPNDLEEDNDDDEDYREDDMGMDGATFDGVFENDADDRGVPQISLSGEAETNFADFDFAQFDSAGINGSGSAGGFDFEAFFPTVKTDVSSSFADVFSSSDADINLMSDDVFSNFTTTPDVNENANDLSTAELKAGNLCLLAKEYLINHSYLPETFDGAMVSAEDIIDASQATDVFNQSTNSSIEPNLSKET